MRPLRGKNEIMTPSSGFFILKKLWWQLKELNEKGGPSNNVANVNFVEGHGKRGAGIYYNTVKKAEMTNNHYTMKSRLGIGNTLKTARISPRAQDVPPTMTPTIA